MKFFFIFFSILLFTLNFYAQEQVVFYFDNNKSELNKVEQAKLVKWIAENKTSKILSITGSTDEVGSNGYNDTLSQKRVSFIFNQIKDKVKIREDFKSISLGEKGAKSKNKAENRKSIIHFLLEKDLAKENEILNITKNVDDTISNQIDFVNILQKSRVGDKIVLENIEFYLGTDIIDKSSFSKLDRLFQVLSEMDKMKIEVQGHICCNPNLNDKLSLKLSKNRAKRIVEYLIEKGINSERLNFNGFGSNFPIYAIPESNEEQQRKNRRVEILILDK
ncbi:OmpA family protein [Flavobacterium sp.]|jgi:outer membrane protein OmpA-like peptidoglycan-associated protein|uniref:OmpA family protein n=1 Tax=Flavobacterium sp. TaxID=239 RepID=UPI0037C0749E